MSHVNIACSGCEKIYKIARHKLPAKGAKTKCKQCSTLIVIKPAKYYDEKSAVKPVTSEQNKLTVTDNEKLTSEPKSSPQKTKSETAVIAKPDAKVSETINELYSKNINPQMADKLKKGTASARAKGEQVKSRAFDELNKLGGTNQTALIIVLSTGVFFLLAKLLNNVYFVGALFDRLMAIFFLLFFIFVVMGCIKGVKKEVVVYYDKKDVFNAFKILGSLIVTFLGFSIAMSAILGSELANSAPVNLINVILCVSVPSYFLYLSIADALYHNQNESVVNKASAICVKIGIGILYPLVILHEVSNIGTHTTVDGYGNKTTRHHSPVFLMVFMALGGALIWKLINGDTVYAKRKNDNIDSE